MTKQLMASPDYIVRNLESVFRSGDISKLTKASYGFITLHMGHIAHFSLYGFQGVYKDLRLLAHSLQTSEYSDDTNHQLNWADELERRERDGDTGDQGKDKADLIRRIVEVARDWEASIEERFDAEQKVAELDRAAELAAKHGYKLFPKEEG